MARYTVLGKTFLNGRMCEAGDVVDYDGQPGSTLQPMETRPSVDIPDDWRDENGLKRIALAKTLGAPKQRLSAAEADQWISNELANREAKAAEKKAAPSPVKSLFTPTPNVSASASAADDQTGTVVKPLVPSTPHETT